jgi:DNA gyrase subunit A
MQQEGEEKLERKIGKFKYLFMTTKDGTAKKTEISEYENIRGGGLIAITLAKGDELRWVRPTRGDDEIIIVSKKGKSIHFKEEDVRETGRDTMGVRGIKLEKDDEVIAADVVRKTENLLLTVSENGFGKTTEIKQYSIQGRGGQGLYAARINTKTGDLVAARLIDHPHMELLIISEKGQAVKIKTDDLPARNRHTSGVKLIRLKKGDKVSAIAIV